MKCDAGYTTSNITFMDATSVRCYSQSSPPFSNNSSFIPLTSTFSLSGASQQNCSSLGSTFSRQLLAAKVNIGVHDSTSVPKN